MSSSSHSAGSASARRVVVGGITTQVYGVDALPTDTSTSGLAVLFFLHGRFGKAEEPKMIKWAKAFVDSAREQRRAAGGSGKSLIVVTFDQRNHGDRTVDAVKNKSWKDKVGDGDDLDNPLHAQDMLSIQTGTARDVSFLIDYLAPCLFPHDEHKITDYFVSGVSLGGHSTWIALAHEPRLSLGIPIIGSPDMLALLSARAKSLPPPYGPLDVVAPYFPQSLLNLIERTDPVNVDRRVWRDRKILVLGGKDDKLVPHDGGGTASFIDVLEGREGVGAQGHIEAFVQDGVGHAFSDEMAERARSFLWEHGLKAQSNTGRL